jgi:hypothetical protein
MKHNVRGRADTPAVGQVTGTATITTEEVRGTHHDTSSTGIQVVYGLRCMAYQAEDIYGILLARNYERLMQDSTVTSGKTHLVNQCKLELNALRLQIYWALV